MFAKQKRHFLGGAETKEGGGGASLSPEVQRITARLRLLSTSTYLKALDTTTSRVVFLVVSGRFRRRLGSSPVSRRHWTNIEDTGVL